MNFRGIVIIFENLILLFITITLPETSSRFAPENGWLEGYIVSFWEGLFFRGELLVLGNVNHPNHQKSNSEMIFLQILKDDNK